MTHMYEDYAGNLVNLDARLGSNELEGVVEGAELIVELRDGVSANALDDLRNTLGFQVVRGAGSGLQLWNVLGDPLGAAALLSLSSDIASLGLNKMIGVDVGAAVVSDASNGEPGVGFEGGGVGVVDRTSNDPYLGSLWGLGKINAQEAWDIATGSDSVVIGVIDTGIDVDHPDLDGNIWVNMDEIWGDGVDNDGNGYVDDYNGYDFYRNQGIGPGYAYDDENGHGTHVAGTIAAEGNNGIGVSGVAWNASLMALKFLNSAGSGWTYDAVRAIDYATNNGAHMTNNSWGGGGYSSSLYGAISRAASADVLFVAAAGNDGTNNDNSAHYPSNYTLDNVISVAATTQTDGRATFSNYGATSVDLGAPGYAIYSTYLNSQYATLSGTSMATPHVTGVAALLLSADSSLNYGEIRAAIFDSVDTVPSMAGITTTGGRLNAETALDYVTSGQPPARITLSDQRVDENAAGAIVATLSTTGGVGDLTYNIFSDPESLFEIRNGNELALRSGIILDHEADNAHFVSIEVTDSNGDIARGSYRIDVTDVNEAPTGIGGDVLSSVAETAVVGTVLGTLAVTGDPDDGDTHTYALLDDHGGLFSIDTNTGVLTVSGTLNFDSAQSHSLAVRAADSGGLSVDRTTDVQVEDVNLAPVLGEGQGYVSPGGTLTGQLDATDPEGGAVTISLVSGPAHGALDLGDDGSYIFVADDAYSGADTFDVLLSDSVSATSATFILNVTSFARGGPLMELMGDTEVLNATTAGPQGGSSADVLSDGSYVVAYHHTNTTGGMTERKVFLRRFGADGTAIGGELTVASGTNDGWHAMPTVKALPDGGYVVAWYHEVTDGRVAIVAQRFDVNGSRVGSEIQVSDGDYDTDVYTAHSTISIEAVDSGGYLVAWGHKNNESGIRRVHENGSLGTQQDIFGQKSYGVELEKLSDGSILAVDISVDYLSRNTYISSQRESRIQKLTDDGVPIGEAASFELSSAYGSHPSAAALDDGGYVIVYTDIDNDRSGIYMLRYDADGNQVAGKELVNQRETYSQRHPTVAALDDGGFIVTWTSGEEYSASFASTNRPFARRYDADGNAVTDEFQIGNQYAMYDDHVEPLVLNGGDVVAVWSATRYWDDIDGDKGGIVSQRIDMYEGDDTGTPGNDDYALSDSGVTVDTGAGDDRVQGGAGADVVDGGSGDDGLFGNGGNDTLIGGTGTDSLSGGADDDTLTGGSGADLLFGGLGNDLLIADLDDLIIDGGEGFDIVRIDASAGGSLSIDLSSGSFGGGTIGAVESISFSTGSSIGTSSVVADVGYEEIDLIVDLNQAVSLEAIASARNLLSAEVVFEAGSGIEYWTILDQAVDVDAVISELGIESSVDLNQTLDMSAQLAVEVDPATVVADYNILPDATVPSDPYFGSLYGMDDINAPEAWDIRTDASNIVIGVIDTGIDVDHPDLVNNLWVNEGEIWGDGIDNDGNGYIDDYHGYDFYNGHGIGPGYSRDDDHSHGTHVAGTIAAEGNNGIGVSGVAWQAQLMAVKIFSAAGRTTTSAIVQGIRYATMMGADITNNSWGGGGYSSSILSAITDAQNSGSVFVAAAGNNYGRNNDSYRYYPSGYSLDNIVAVASTDSSDRLSSFSNYGATTVDLGAPGSSIRSTIPGGGYGYKSGTSMATPHVAGALALIMAEDSSLSYSQAIAVLMDTTQALSSLAGRTVSGGRLDLYAALDSLQLDEPPAFGVRDIVMSNDVTSVDHAFTVSSTLNTSVSVLGQPGQGAITALSNADSGSPTLTYTGTDAGYGTSFTLRATDSEGRTTDELVTVDKVASDAVNTDVVGDDDAETIYGGNEGRTFYGGGGSDVIYAGGGDDWIDAGSGGGDIVDGGSGTDTLSFASAIAAVTASLETGSGAGDSFSSIESLEGSAYNDTLSGDGSANRLFGGDGNDTLSGGDGADTLIGGEGNDFALYSDTDGVTVSLGDGRRSGSAIGDTFDSIEGLVGGAGGDLLVGASGANLLIGNGGSDTLIGGAGSDFLTGDGGNDLIVGGAGDDTLYGGAGDDIFYSGTGNDTVNGGTGSDTLHLGYVSGVVDINFDTGVAIGADFGTVTFQNVEFVTFETQTGGTVLATDAVETFADPETLTLSYAGSNAAVTLDLAAGTGSGGAAEGDTLLAVTSVAGSGHDDRITSGYGDETVDGAGGSDTVVFSGAVGDYSLTGNAGTVTVTDSQTGRDGADTLINVESLVFSDGILNLRDDVSIILVGGTVAENAGAGVDMGTISALTLSDEVFSLSLTDGASGAVTFDPDTGGLAATRSFDFETEPSVSIVVTAAGDRGTTISQTLALAVADVNEAPEDLAVASFAIAEDASSGDAVGTIEVNDPDVGDVHSFLLFGDASGLFSIDAQTGVISVAGALDHETVGSHTLTVQGTDGGGLSNTWPVTITVGDVNEAPTVALTSFSTGENSAIGAAIGTVAATDQDVGDSVTFSLTDDADGRFSVDAATGVVRVAASLDHERAASHTVTVRATDAGGLTDDRQVRITVTDENDAPLAQDDAALAQEETALTLTPTSLLSNDMDPDGDTLSISAVGNAVNGSVDIDQDGSIVFTPNDETVGAASFDYTVDDGRGGSNTATVNLTIEAIPMVDTGGEGQDEMLGGSASDSLFGGDGADTLMGRKGDDVLMGGSGDDVYVFRAGDGADVFSEYAEVTRTGTTTRAETRYRQVAYQVYRGETWQTAYRTESYTAYVTEEYSYTEQVDGGLDTLRFGDGITLEDLSGWLEGDDLILSLEDGPAAAGGIGFAAAGDSIRLQNWMDQNTRVENFAFNNSLDSVVGAAEILGQIGTDGDDAITWTETAVSLNGRGGNDTLTTGDFDDTLTGGAGDDILSGGGGTDTAVLTGRLEDYLLDLSEAQVGTIGISDQRGVDGSDTLLGIEILSFTDGTLELTGENIAPFARPDSLSATEDTALTMSLADLTGNDLSLDGDALMISSVGAASNGIVSLDGNGGVVFTPDADYNGAAGFTYTVSDGNGGQSTGMVELSVGAVNDAPIAGADSAAGLEDNALTIALADLLSNDSDVEGDALTVTAVGNAVNGSVVQDGSGNPIFTPDADYVGVASFDYTVSDGQGGRATQSVSLSFSNTNDTPTAIGFSGGTVAEDAASGTSVANASAVDPDTGDTHNYTLTNNAGGLFVIDDATGMITLAGAVDHEAAGSHTLTVLAQDVAGETVTSDLTVTVSDVNEAPVSSGLDATTVGENAAVGDVVGTASVIDPDAGDSLSYSLTDDAGGLFTIDTANGVVTVAGALDFETAQNHVITIAARDSGGLTDTWTETVSVTDGNDAPVPDAVNLVLRDGAGTSVQITATDPNGDSVTFDPVTSALGTASITSGGVLTYTSGGSGQETLSVSATDDQGMTGTGNVVVSVADRGDAAALTGSELGDILATDDAGDTLLGLGGDDDLRGGAGYDTLTGGTGDDRVDGAGGTDVAVFSGNMTEYVLTQDSGTISVADTVAERDGTDQLTGIETLQFVDGSLDIGSGVALIAGDASVAEDAAIGASAGQVSVLNFTGGGVTLRLADDAGGRFSLDPATGSIAVSGVLDHETNANHVLTIDVSDADGVLTSQQITISVGDVNEAPEGSALSNATIAESAGIGDVIGTVQVNDPDAGDSHSFALTDDAGGRVAIDAATGVLTLAALVDHETDGALTVTVTGTDTGGLSRSWTHTIAVTDVNDTPHALDVTIPATVAEDAVVGTAVGVAAGQDADDGDSLTYSLADDASGLFAIDAATGNITVAGALDYEATTSYDLTVRATDTAGTFIDRTATVSLSNVNEAPVTGADTLSTSEETDISIPPSLLLGNDSDPDGDALTITAVGNGVNGSVSIDDAGRVLFRPDTLFTGTARFDYTVSDGNGLTRTETVTVDVTELQRQLVGGDADDELNGGSGDDTMDGGAGNDILYGRRGDDILAGGAGDDVYRFQIGDGADTVDETVMETQTFSRQVPYTVSGTRAIRTGSGEFLQIIYQSYSYTAYSTEYYEQDVQVDGGRDTIAFGAGILPEHVSAAFDGNDLVLSVDTGGGGGDSLRLTDWANADVRTERVTFVSAPDTVLGVAGMLGLIGGDGDDTVTWTETQANLNGGAGNDTLTTGSSDDTLAGGAGDDVLDAGAGQDTAIFSGTLESYRLAFGGDGQVEVVDQVGTDGTDILRGVETFQFSDGTLTLANGNVAPFVREDSVTTAEDVPITLTAANLLANDLSLDGDAMTITGVSDSQGGTARLVGGDIVFTPDADHNGPARLTYTVSDGRGGTGSSTVSIDVTAVEDAPESLTLTGGTVAEDADVGTTVATVTAVDPDPGETFAYTLLSGGALFGIDSATGVLTLSGSLDYETAATQQVTVRATDSTGRTVDQDLTLTVGDVNEAPTALSLGGTGTVLEDAAVGSVVGTVAVVDQDFGDTHGFTLTDDAGGRFAINAATGAITVTGILDRETSGSHVLQVRATDSDGFAVTQAVTISVGDVDEAPITSADTATTVEDTAVTLAATTLLADDSDPEGGTLSIARLTGVTGGTAVINGSGNIVFTPASDYNGSAVIGYTVRDPSGNESASQVTVDVTAVNDAPTPVADTAGTAEGEAVTLKVVDLLADDTDPDGDSLTFQSISNFINGTAVYDAAAGTVTFTPDDQFVGDGSFDYTVDDGNGGQTTTTVTIAVGAVDQALTGTTGDDVLTGDSGNDTLTGLAGADTLYGRRGADVLQGGAGDDVYRFGIGDGRDTIDDSATTIEQQTRTETYSYQQPYTVQVYRGEGWVTETSYRTVTGTREVTEDVVVEADAGSDEVLFGTGIQSSDLTLVMDGNDLLIGVSGYPDDELRLTNWTNRNNRIETLRFTSDTAVLDYDAIQARIAGTGSILSSSQPDTLSVDPNGGAVRLTDDGDASTTTRVEFGENVAWDRLWFEQAGDDLQVSVIGGEAQLTVGEWFAEATAPPVSEFEAGGSVLAASSVQRLVIAMSAAPNQPMESVNVIPDETKDDLVQLGVDIGCVWQAG